jgi:hypothetical protein
VYQCCIAFHMLEALISVNIKLLIISKLSKLVKRSRRVIISLLPI